MSEQNILSVYKQLSEHYQMPEFEQFKNDISSDDNKLKSVHSKLDSIYSKVPSYEQFSNDMSILDDSNNLPPKSDSNDINTSDGKINAVNNPKKIPLTSDDMVKDPNVDATDLLDKKLQEEREEEEFSKWYSEMSDLTGLDPDPDHPDHKYDYRAAFKAGVKPEEINGELKSSDWGLFQINDKYWKDNPNGPSYKDDVDANINMAKKIYNATGFDSWVTYKDYHRNIKKGEQPKGGAAEYGKAYETLSTLYAQNPQEFLNNPELVVNAMNSLSQSNNFTADNYNKVFNAFYTGKDDTAPKDQKDADIAANKLITSLSVVHAESFGNPNAKNDNYDKVWKWDSQFKQDDHPERYVVQNIDGEDWFLDSKDEKGYKISHMEDVLTKEYGLSEDEISNWKTTLLESGPLEADEVLKSIVSDKLMPEREYSKSLWSLLKDSGNVFETLAMSVVGFGRYALWEGVPAWAAQAKTGVDLWETGHVRTLEKFMEEEVFKKDGPPQPETYAAELLLIAAGKPMEWYEKYGVGPLSETVDKNTEGTLWGNATSGTLRALPFLLMAKGRYNRYQYAKTGVNPSLWSKATKNYDVIFDKAFPEVTVNFGRFSKVLESLPKAEQMAFVSKLAESFNMSKSKVLRNINKGNEIKVNWGKYIKTYDKPWMQKVKAKLGIKSDAHFGARIGHKARVKVRDNGIVVGDDVIIPKYKDASAAVRARVSKTKANTAVVDNALQRNGISGIEKVSSTIKGQKPAQPVGPIPVTTPELTPEELVTIPIKANTLLGISKELEVPSIIYHGSGGKVTPLNLTGQERVLFGGDNPMALIEQLKGQGVKGADKIKTWEDANKFISETYKNDYDLIQFNNSSRPQLGNEYLQTSSGKSFAAEEAHAEIYAKSTGRKEKYKEPVKTEPVKTEPVKTNPNEDGLMKDNFGDIAHPDWDAQLALVRKAFGKEFKKYGVTENELYETMLQTDSRQSIQKELRKLFESKGMPQADIQGDLIPKLLDTIFTNKQIKKAKPTKPESIKTEPKISLEEAAEKAAKADIEQIQPTKTEPIKTETVKTEPVKTEPVNAELPEGVKLVNNKLTIVKRVNEKNKGPIQGIKIKGKDYFAQKSFTGPGGKEVWRQVDLDGNVIGDVILGKDKTTARNKLIRMSREGQAKKPAPIKKELTKAQKEGRLEKIKAKAKIQKELDKVVPGRDKIKLYDKNIDILSKRIKKLKSMPPSKARDAAINKAQLQKDAQHTHRNKYKEIIKESASYLESAIKSKVRKQDTIKRLQNEAKKNPNDVGLKNELNIHKSDLAKLNVILKELAPYKMALKYPEMAMYSAMGPFLPPGTVKFVKQVLQRAKARITSKNLSSVEIKNIYDAITGKDLKALYNQDISLGDPRNVHKKVSDILTKNERNKKQKIFEAMQKSRPWYKKYPEELRKDVGAAIEGIGRIDKKKDSYQDVMDRYTNKHRDFHKEYSISIEEQRRLLNDEFTKMGIKEQISFLENYLPHIYPNLKGKKLKNFTANWSKNNKHAKLRKFPTLKEAVDAGYEPLTQDAAVLYDRWVGANWTVAATKNLVTELQNTLWSDNKPVIRRNKPKLSEDVWLSTTSPVFAQFSDVVWYPEILKNEIKFIEGKSFVDKNVVLSFLQSANQTIKAAQLTIGLPIFNFHTGALMESTAAYTYKNLLKDPKAIIPIISMGLRTKNDGWIWDKADALLKEQDFRDLAFGGGLQIDHPLDYQYHRIISPLLKMHNKIGAIGLASTFGIPVKVATKLLQTQDKLLWDKMHRSYKVVFFDNLVKWMSNDFPLVDRRILAERAAEIVNNNFGGQEIVNKMFLKNPDYRAIAYNLPLSWDWTASNIRNATDAGGITEIFRKGVPGGNPDFVDYGKRFQQSNLLKQALNLYILQQMAQTLSNSFNPDDPNNRDFIWQNEKGNRLDGDITHLYRFQYDTMQKIYSSTGIDKIPGIGKLLYKPKTDEDWGDQRYYIKMGKQMKEILRWITAPGQSLYSKSGPGIQIVNDVIFGNSSLFADEYTSDIVKQGRYGVGMSGFKARLSRFLDLVTPFALKPTSKNFIGMFPVGPGATFNKTKVDFENYLIAYSDDSLMDRLLGREEGLISHLEFYEKFPQIIDAAERNGVDWEKAFESAITKVSYESQRLAIEAFSVGDIEEAKRLSRRAINLGANNVGFFKMLRNSSISEAEYEKIEDIFRNVGSESDYEKMRKDGWID